MILSHKKDENIEYQVLRSDNTKERMKIEEFDAHDDNSNTFDI